MLLINYLHIYVVKHGFKAYPHLHLVTIQNMCTVLVKLMHVKNKFRNKVEMKPKQTKRQKIQVLYTGLES